MADHQQRPSNHQRFYRFLLERVRDDPYPSALMLDLLEQGLRGQERDALVQVLVEKVNADRFPSVPMLQRLARLSG